MLSTLTPSDLAFVVGRLPRDVISIVREQGLYVGGGFIRETIAGNAVQDIDLFGPTEQKLEAAAAYLTQKRQGANLHKTPNAITVLSAPRLPVQFITRWCFDDPNLVVESFDFTVCQAVIWFDKGRWQSLCSSAFYPDLAARRLVYTYPVREEAAGGSLLRVRKFLARGYNIQAEGLAGVVARLALAVTPEHLPGDPRDEKAWAFVIKGLLHEVDPIHAIDGVELIDEHEVLEGAEFDALGVSPNVG